MLNIAATPLVKTLSPKDVITILETATRTGGDIDTPEGSRYIIISDTLAKLMAKSLGSALDAYAPKTKPVWP